jgi:hypothetical protein
MVQLVSFINMLGTMINWSWIIFTTCASITDYQVIEDNYDVQYNAASFSLNLASRLLSRVTDVGHSTGHSDCPSESKVLIVHAAWNETQGQIQCSWVWKNARHPLYGWPSACAHGVPIWLYRGFEGCGAIYKVASVRTVSNWVSPSDYKGFGRADLLA